MAFTKYTGVNSLWHLKRIAKFCVLLQFFACIIYFSSSIFFPKSNSTAIWCGILAITISLAPIFYALIKRDFFLVFSCISAFNLAPIWFLYLEAVLKGYDAYTYTEPIYRMEAFYWISVFQLSANLFYILLWEKIAKFSIKAFSFLPNIKVGQELFTTLTILSFALPLISFYFFYGSGTVLWSAMTAGRSGGGSSGGLLVQEYLGKSSSLMLPLNWLWQLTPLFSSIVFISARKKLSVFPVLSLSMGLIVIFVFFLGGSRGTMMFVAAPVLFFLFYYNWHRGFKFWIVATMLLVTLIGIMELQVRFRGNLLDVISDPSKAAKNQGLSSATSFDPTETHRDNNMYLLCLMIKGYPTKYPYEGFNDFVAILVNPIPRTFWSGKPILKGAQELSFQSPFVLDGPLFMGTTSLSYSIVGDGYQAMGLVGILVYALIYALFLIYFDGLIYYTTNRPILIVGILGISVFLAFWGYRGFFAFVSFLYPLILIILLIQLVKIFSSKKIII